MNPTYRKTPTSTDDRLGASDTAQAEERTSVPGGSHRLQRAGFLSGLVEMPETEIIYGEPFDQKKSDKKSRIPSFSISELHQKTFGLAADVDSGMFLQTNDFFSTKKTMTSSKTAEKIDIAKAGARHAELDLHEALNECNEPGGVIKNAALLEVKRKSQPEKKLRSERPLSTDLLAQEMFSKQRDVANQDFLMQGTLGVEKPSGETISQRNPIGSLGTPHASTRATRLSDLPVTPGPLSFTDLINQAHNDPTQWNKLAESQPWFKSTAAELAKIFGVGEDVVRACSIARPDGDAVDTQLMWALKQMAARYEPLSRDQAASVKSVLTMSDPARHALLEGLVIMQKGKGIPSRADIQSMINLCLEADGRMDTEMIHRITTMQKNGGVLSRKQINMLREWATFNGEETYNKGVLSLLVDVRAGLGAPSKELLDALKRGCTLANGIVGMDLITSVLLAYRGRELPTESRVTNFAQGCTIPGQAGPNPILLSVLADHFEGEGLPARAATERFRDWCKAADNALNEDLLMAFVERGYPKGQIPHGRELTALSDRWQHNQIKTTLP